MLTRLLQRLLILVLGVVCVWLIVFVVFKSAHNRLPFMLAVAVTYGLAAYFILPRAVRMGLKVLKRERVPRYTITGDGLPGDPVNLLLVGTKAQLHAAFAAAGWAVADRLNVRSAWRMARAFLLNAPYPTAPFSTLYLFDRGQDVGFQKAIDDSPRKRHHVRFWALSLQHAETTLGTSRFWRTTRRPPDDARVIWVGAATKDIGFSLTKLTFQITHATDDDTNAEREFIMAELSHCKAIDNRCSYQASQHVRVDHVNHYIADGEIAAATLAAVAAEGAVDRISMPRPIDDPDQRM